MITVLWHENGSCTRKSVDDLLSIPHESIPKDVHVWVDMQNSTAEEEQSILIEWMGVHRLVLEDMKMAANIDNAEPHHPSIEEFPDHLFVILQAPILVDRRAEEVLAEHLGRIQQGQLNLILTEQVIITHHPIALPVIAIVQKVVEKGRHYFERGPDYIMALILDEIIDDTNELLEIIDERAAELEQVMLRTESMSITTRMLALKRRVHTIRRSLTRQDEIVYRLSKGEYRLVNKDEAVYYRDAHDHHIIAIDHVDSLRDSLTGLMEVFFSLSSSRLNSVMRILTVISTIFLPITFITSLYGMNFEFMPELKWPWGYPLVLLAILFVSTIMLMLFKRRGWLG